MEQQSNENEAACGPSVLSAGLGVTVSAKPIVWETEGPQNPEGKQDWNEIRYGFWISLDPDGGATMYPYLAAWGEGDEDTFETLAEAQEWCQQSIDDWVGDNAVLTPNAEITGAESVRVD